MKELFNRDAEQEILAALAFHGRDAWQLIRDAHCPVEAFSPESRGAFRVLLTLAERGAPCEVPAVREQALELGEIAVARTVEDWLGAALDHLGGIQNTAHYAGIVADLGRRRTLIDVARQVSAAAADRAVPVAEVVADSVGRLLATTTARHVAASEDGINAALEDIERTAKLGGIVPGVSTGIATLDDLLEGLCPERLVVLAARPGAGKTAFATYLAHTAAEGDVETYFVTLEQPKKQLQQRRLALMTGLNLWRIKRDEKLWARHAGEIMTAGNALKRAPLTFDEHADTATSISLAVQRHSAAVKRPVALLVVDYLSWVRFEGPKADRQDIAIGQVTKRLARLAKEMSLCVVLLAQLNRESVKDGKARRPTLADLRDSGAIEQDADQVLLLWEPPTDRNQTGPTLETTVEFVVAKNRHGPLGHVLVDWSKATNGYVDRPWRPQQAAA